MYEVITGRSTVRSKITLGHAAILEEMRRIIREEDPTKPSSPGSQATSRRYRSRENRARLWQTEVASLSRLLGRELEWIPSATALRKERHCERYDSAKDMAQDIRRYLGGQPLEAGPESAIVLGCAKRCVATRAHSPLRRSCSMVAVLQVW